MARKISIRPGMSKYQIQRQIKQAFNDAVNNSTIQWTCPHGYRHNIRIGSIGKGVKRPLHCGCTYVGT